MQLSEESVSSYSRNKRFHESVQVLRCGGYDVLVYLRFIKLAMRIFGCFAPYAFVVLLPVNASVYYSVPLTAGPLEEEEDDAPTNTFNRLSLSSMPRKDPRMWAHCLGVYLLTGLAMHFLNVECKWYTRLRHRFLTERDHARQRTVLVQQVPVELQSSPKLAEYFAKLYPGKVVGAVVCRKTDRLDALVAARDKSQARFDRVEERRMRRKMTILLSPDEQRCLHRAANRYSSMLEDLYDPMCWRFEAKAYLNDRSVAHERDTRRLDERIAHERHKQASFDPLVGRPVAARKAVGGGELSMDAVEGGDKVVVSPAVATPDDVEAPPILLQSRRRNPFDDDDDDSSKDEEDLGERREVERQKKLRDLWIPSSGKSSWRDEDDDDDEALSRCGVCCSRMRRGGAEAAALLGGESTREKLVGDKAFVTFNAFAGAAVATQVFHAATPGGMHASMAPEPRDVFWQNVHVSSKQRTTRKVIANAIVALLLIFYIVPVTLISFVLSEESIKTRWPAMRRYSEKSLVVAAFVQMCQPMGLIVLMLLLPPFFLGLGFWEGHLSWSSNTLNQLSRYYSFQITNVLLVTTVAGSVLKCLETIVENPKMTFALLGESLPQVCAFFSCYIFIKAFSGLTIELCRAVAACQQIAKRLVYPFSTKRDRAAEVLGLRDFENPGWFSYGKFGAQDLLVVVLLMTYSVMTPVVLVPGMIFLCMASVVYRHQLLYVYTPIFESGGLLWPRIYRRILFSLFILHFTMTGIFFLKKAYYQGYAVLALSAATYLYKVQMRTMYVTSSSVAHHLPIELATAVDNAMRYEGCEDTSLATGLADYLQPGLQSSSSSSSS